MDDDQHQKMQAQLEEGRKIGISRAGDNEGFFCSSCDGACNKTSE